MSAIREAWHYVASWLRWCSAARQGDRELLALPGGSATENGEVGHTRRPPENQAVGTLLGMAGVLRAAQMVETWWSIRDGAPKCRDGDAFWWSVDELRAATQSIGRPWCVTLHRSLSGRSKRARRARPDTRGVPASRFDGLDERSAHARVKPSNFLRMSFASSRGVGFALWQCDLEREERQVSAARSFNSSGEPARVSAR